MRHTSLLGLVLFLALLVQPGLRAQTSIPLRGIEGGRGLVLLGEPGTTGNPAQPVDGDLGGSSALVDLDGDGLDELVVGAPNLPTLPDAGAQNGAGHVYILFGSGQAANPELGAERELATLASGVGIDLRGAPGDHLGASVAAAGDVNGDGFDDVILGAPGASSGGLTQSGGAYLLFGAADLSTLPNNAAMTGLTGTSRAVFLAGVDDFGAAGMSVGGDVDVNGDLRADVVLGAPLASTGARSQNGVATILYGAAGLPSESSVDLASGGTYALTRVEGADDFQFLGQSVAGLGRFDPVLPGGGQDLVDGDDVALGAPGALGGGQLFAGAVFVVRGDSGGNLPETLSAGDFGGPTSPGLVYEGAAAGDQLGSWVGSVGDLVGNDGFVELAASAPYNDALGRPDAGALYLLPGRLDGIAPDSFGVGTIGPGGPTALRIFGPVLGEGRGGIVASRGFDYDNDGLPELAVAFPEGSTNDGGFAAEAGIVRLLDAGGLDPRVAHTVDLALVGPSLEVTRLWGESATSLAGTSLAVGDHNGDGFLDLAVGAPGAASDALSEDATGVAHLGTGRGHLLFGPMSRIGPMSPERTHYQGPQVDMVVYNLDLSEGLTLIVDGIELVPDELSGGAPGSVRFTLPPPISPVGSMLDVTLLSAGGLVTLEGTLGHVAMAVLEAPVPADVVVGTEVSIVGEGFSSVDDMTVQFDDGSFVTEVEILELDPIAGTMLVEVPSGYDFFSEISITITGTNGFVDLPDALTIRPFILSGVEGVDVGEFIEIAGPSGTNLTGWKVLFYSGETGLTDDDDDITLNGVILNQGDGFGTTVVPTPGIPNGPDAVCLIDDDDDVIDFISYAGPVTAANGPANGMEAVLIPFAEDDRTRIGDSLQLVGTGGEVDDFMWTEVRPDSPGTVNENQVFEQQIDDDGEPWINEIHYDNGELVSQESGVVIEPAPGFSFLGTDPVGLDLTVSSPGGVVPGDLVIEVGTDAVGFKTISEVSIDGEIVTFDMPSFFVGPETPIQVRASSGSNTVLLSGALTLDASDYVEDASLASSGLASEPPDVAMSGDFTQGGRALLLIRDLESVTNTVLFFVSTGVLDPPQMIEGGLLGVDPTGGTLGAAFVVTIATGGDLEEVPAPIILPNNAIAGLELYMQAVTVETNGVDDDYGFSNLLTATVDEAELEAKFLAQPLQGTAPLEVQFFDDTIGTVTSWAWDFGDGGMAFVEDPVHLYTDAGSYDVTLTVTGPLGEASLTRTGYIQVDDPAP